MMTPETDVGWSWFDEGPDVPTAEDLRLLRMEFARCFSTSAGEAVLSHLRDITQRRFYGPEAPDRAIRHIEGQRHLVAYIGAMIERGQNGQ